MNEIALWEDRTLISKVEITTTSLILDDSLSFDEWSKIGHSLQKANRAIHWWIGDWLRFGERKYGEMYAQALEETPFEYLTLRNDVWVADAIELSRRRDNLSWARLPLAGVGAPTWQLIQMYHLISPRLIVGAPTSW